MAWVESVTPSFRARHESDDAADAEAVLEDLERLRERLDVRFPTTVGDLSIVFHRTELSLDMSQPLLPLARRIAVPAARRYMVGWAAREEIHLLAPRLLRERASNVSGSRELLMTAPGALYARVVIAANSKIFPPPLTPRRALRSRRWTWLSAGAAQWFAGQTAHLRPAVAVRMREGRRPSFPPGLRDAALLGGTVVDLLAREEGPDAVVKMLLEPDRAGPRAALGRAFGDRSLEHTEGTWRAHLARIASA